VTDQEEFVQGVINWVQGLPVAWAHGLTVVLFLALLAGCWLIPRRQVIADAPDERWRDLRLWASALIVVQLGLYQLFS